MKDFVLDRTLVSAEEKIKLLSALQGLQTLTEDKQDFLLTKLESIFKVSAKSWLEVDLTDWRKRKGQKDLFDTIKQAILDKRRLSITYLSGNGQKMIRTVEPFKLVFKKETGIFMLIVVQKKIGDFLNYLGLMTINYWKKQLTKKCD